MNPLANTYYQHKYGGIYKVDVPIATDTRDGSVCAIYTHVYPFESHTYIRPLSEWDSRFRELIPTEVTTLCGRDREELKAEIKAAKEANAR